MTVVVSENSRLCAGARFPPEALAAGCKTGAIGTHSSRTLIAQDLSTLLTVTGAGARRSDYARAIIEDNCLGKSTEATRMLSLQRLSELYALDPDVQLFRTFRRLWNLRDDGRVLLALLLAIARDPLLAATVPPIVAMNAGDELQRDQLRTALASLAGDRFNPGTLDKIVRNTASSWTQSGHLKGRTFKKRQRVDPTAPDAAFALLLAHLTGFRGSELFASGWFAVLDCTPGHARALALDAKRHGLIDLRVSGEVVELDLTRLDPWARS